MKIQINADIVIDGVGGLHNKQFILIENGKISYMESKAPGIEVNTSYHTPVLMPGVWECHGHYTGFTKPAVEEALFIKSATAGARATWDLKETLKAGVTSVREVGGLGIFLKHAINDNSIIGPNIYSAGKILSTTGGHGDMHNVPLELLDHIGEMSLGAIVDGVSECMKGVRSQLRDGADLIKICASGGVMSEIDNPMHQQFSLEEIKAIVDEAARAEASVAAHCHGEAGIKVAIEGGCKTIEHGTYLTEELADKMIEKDVILVPTRYVIEKLKSLLNSPELPKYAREKASKLIDQHEDSLRLAIKKGVKIATGTDIFTSGPNSLLKQGENLQEIELLVKYGMTPMQAIISATSIGPQTLGKRAPKSGRIEVGYDADLLFLSKNPLDDISILSKQENVNFVMKGGNIVKFDR